MLFDDQHLDLRDMRVGKAGLISHSLAAGGRRAAGCAGTA